MTAISAAMDELTGLPPPAGLYDAAALDEEPEPPEEEAAGAAGFDAAGLSLFLLPPSPPDPESLPPEPASELDPESELAPEPARAGSAPLRLSVL